MKINLQKQIKVLFLIPFLLWQVSAYAQQTIKGVIKDASTRESLPGVNIVIKGTTNGTSTGLKGTYELAVPSLNDTLVFSYIGYKTKTVPINGRNVINVNLAPQTLVGQQMVVVGYGVQKKKDLTGSISVISAKDFKNSVTPSIGDALQGRMAGVTVQTSGDPGAAPIIKIRGPSTFTDNSPLYVVDGVPVGGIQDFNLDDVASIQVLKDASAAAIYGSRAANGVVIITTKQGKKGPVKVNYSAYYGTQNITGRYKMMDSKQYQTLDNLELTNAGMALAPANDPTSQYFVNPSKINTNWQNATFKTATVQNHNLTISGGDQNSTFAITGNYYNQGGTIQGPGPDFTRYSGRVNSDHTFGKFKVSESMYFAHWDKINLTGLHLTSPIMDIVHAIPTQPIYDPNNLGGYSGTNANIRKAISLNVIGANNLLESTTKVNRFLGSISGQYAFTKDLYYKFQFSYDHSMVNGFNFVPQYNLGFFYTNDIAKLDMNRNEYSTQLMENTLHYKKDIGDHHFTVLLGYTQQQDKFNTIDGHAEGYTPPYFKVLNAGTSSKTATGYQTEGGLRSYLGRITYNFRDTYLIDGTIRRDGSSRFGTSHKYGTFPSISAGWRISNEGFFKKISFLNKNVNNLKLRASLGTMGNQNIGDYAYTAYINSNALYDFNNTLANGSTQISLADPNIKWETTISRDIGIDMGMWNDKLDLTVDYYNNLSKNLLLAVPIPMSVGAVGNPTVNAASLLNKGFEFTLEYRDRVGEFNYDLTGNLATLQNKVLSLGGGKPIYQNGTKTAVGHPIGAIYGYVMNGIFQNWNEVYSAAYQNQAVIPGQYGSNGVPVYDTASRNGATHTAPGDIRYKDLNGDGFITSADRTYLGSAIPKFTYGFNANLSYKNWDMSLFFQGVYGNKIINRVRQTIELMDGYGNYDSYVYHNHWTPQNHSTTVPRAIFSDPNNNGRDSQRWVEDGSYLRLQNIQIGYSLPKKLLNRFGITNIRIYAQGQNVFTLTKYTGYTPVISTVGAAVDGPIGGGNDGLYTRGVDVGAYPQPRTLSMGISLNF